MRDEVIAELRISFFLLLSILLLPVTLLLLIRKAILIVRGQQDTGHTEETEIKPLDRFWDK